MAELNHATTQLCLQVREALSEGRIDLVTHYLDRKHRLVLDLDRSSLAASGGRVRIPRSASLNLLPAVGSYRAAAQLVPFSAAVAPFC